MSNRARDWLYMELLLAVESKFEGESRHETALRYIKERENRKGELVDGDGIIDIGLSLRKKGVVMNCMNCDKDLGTNVTERKKFCNATCRIEYYRNTHKVPLQKEGVTVTENTAKEDITVTGDNVVTQSEVTVTSGKHCDKDESVSDKRFRLTGRRYIKHGDPDDMGTLTYDRSNRLPKKQEPNAINVNIEKWTVNGETPNQRSARLAREQTKGLSKSERYEHIEDVW